MGIRHCGNHTRRNNSYQGSLYDALYSAYAFCTKLYKNIYVMLYQSSSSEMKKSALSVVGVSSGVDSSSFFSPENKEMSRDVRFVLKGMYGARVSTNRSCTIPSSMYLRDTMGLGLKQLLT